MKGQADQKSIKGGSGIAKRDQLRENAAWQGERNQTTHAWPTSSTKRKRGRASSGAKQGQHNTEQIEQNAQTQRRTVFVDVDERAALVHEHGRERDACCRDTETHRDAMRDAARTQASECATDSRSEQLPADSDAKRDTGLRRKPRQCEADENGATTNQERKAGRGAQPESDSPNLQGVSEMPRFLKRCSALNLATSATRCLYLCWSKQTQKYRRVVSRRAGVNKRRSGERGRVG